MKLICVLALALCVVCVLGQLPSQDILALLEFKKGIKHDPTGYVMGSWNDESIDFNGCPSSWNGIMCNGGNIAAVVLENLGLVADADLSLFSNLTKLVKLSLTNNSVSGKLPNNIGDFKTLEYLDLSNNLFSSTLPPGIARLGSLKNLSLSSNNFSGSLPDTISGLKSIQSLDLSGNSFSGPLPLSFLKLDNLLVLNLSNNEFTENIPKGFELMANLVVLDLHKNNLNGELDPEFLLLTAATHIDFSGNQLANSRSQPQMFIAGISETVKYLNLSYNQLTGSFVGEAQVFENLKVLDLSNNQLSGELPGFSFVFELEVLKLCNNMFSGYIPDNLLKGDALVLTELDLSGNNLTGPISMITSTTLRKLNLSSNSLSGEIPLVTGSCTVIDLSRNQFEGNLTRLLKWANIEILDLSGNRFTGIFPEVTAQFLRLNYLNISHNTLNGPLPKVITHFPKLSVLDLSSNNLSGPFLATLLTMPTIQELHLQGNLLSGTIDFFPPPYNDSNLRVLDLSNNQLSGDFPEGFGSLFAIQDLDISGNRFTGSVPVSLCDINSLSSLDISKNQFTGSLPENLPDSLEMFNASLNDLSGVVPEILRKFPLSSFFPGNSKLQFPNAPDGSNLVPSENRGKKRTIIRVVIIIACVLVLIILILLCVFVCYKRMSKKPLLSVTTKDVRQQPPKTRSATLTVGGNTSGLMVSAADIKTSMKKETSTDTITSDEKLAAITGFSPSKNSHFSWSPESGDSYNTDNNNSIARLDVKSPDPLAGELYFLDDTISFTPEELSKAPAEVLGRSSHGTSYRATLDNGLFLTVKWLREGVAKQRKDFAKEAKKFANIRHPNVVTLRGYYWGSTQHEKLILSDYIAPGSLASFLYDRPGRKEPPLVWAQRLKISVGVARGLNYLHFDRVVPHGNLKATNILLDGQDLNARVTDYCLHRLITQTGTIEQILDAGVLGYRAPELASSRKPLPSFKSDVYAFGVVLLELLTGKCAGDVVSSEDGGVDLTEWVRLRVTEGRGSDCYDAMLVPELMIPAAEKGMNEVLGIALRCIRPVSERPGIKTIYEDLSSI